MAALNGITVYYNFSPDSNSEISLKIGQYLMNLKRTKTSVPIFGPPCKTSETCSVGMRYYLTKTVFDTFHTTTLIVHHKINLPVPKCMIQRAVSSPVEFRLM